MVMIIELFLAFMRIGALSFGGAYAAVPLVEREVVSAGWMSAAEFSDLMAIDELTPGPILINSATFVGMRAAGIPGAVAATLGCILPPCLITLVLVCLVARYRNAPVVGGVLHALKCMTFGLIASTLLSYGMRVFVADDVPGVVVLPVVALSYAGLRFRRLSPIVVVVACGCVGLVSHALFASVV